MRIIIVGAGIGGLATALSLEAAGFRDIEIYERAPRILGLGVGINLLPHAMRELTELGLAERVEQLGVGPAALSYHNRHGQLIWQEPRGISAGYLWPQMSVHRGRLQLMLLEAVRERLGDVVHVDHRLVDVRHAAGGGSDRAEFITSRGSVAESADVIVGADGIHSTVRSLHFPAEGPPVWSGLTVWRGTAVIPGYLDGRTMIMAGDGDQKFVAYPLGRADDEGRTVVNFIAERRVGGSPDADWNRSVDAGPIVEMFRDWQFDWLDVPGTIAAADEILEYPMVDRDALPRWTFGRTVLLGDAAHAMYPNGSNGGSQAILDARTLAYHLAGSSSVDAALSAYDADRRPAMTRLLALTRQTGPERVMQLAYERAPGGFDDVHDVIPRDELQAIADEYKQAAGFAPDVLNTRPSLVVGSEA
ncbi:MAG: flavin-dependent oxidoreductase [Microbacterium sp.]